MKILIPIDGSPCSAQTLAWASRFLQPQGSHVFLLTVIDFTPEVPVTDLDIEKAEALLSEAQATLKQAGFTIEKAHYLIGESIQAICQYATEIGAEQIVMGSHGRSGLAKVLMGSVSEGVFKRAKQPVLVVNNGPQSSLHISHIEQLELTQQ